MKLISNSILLKGWGMGGLPSAIPADLTSFSGKGGLDTVINKITFPDLCFFLSILRILAQGWVDILLKAKL